MPSITHINGDLFSAPPNTILVHACNALGSWGAGIAAVFKERFPSQFEAYHAHCKAHDSVSLVGTCLLLPDDGGVHDIACLFTSKAYGKRVDSPEQILEATRMAVQDLVKQNTANKELHACRFNSGKFGVAWEETEAVLKDFEIDWVIYQPEEPDNTRRSRGTDNPRVRRLGSE
ncbi:hypothetical protein K435DRAFT_697055 [Dendrothele bispora CBS 962.96]|uniref:ADP-ribose 1''-phosphate phosphatase n=1 Tax=Dendrothele bispora (strain CBS 962.96) TaxID=1314807 RepID=A0A4S8KV54_DENBC|nr:hypothetical protein K435DRAFT_697055 [Dendrothele bispora CBS 962.96]